MKTSVAICTFNGEQYLETQLQSIIDQSIKVDEIIICDDRSNDRTRSILMKFEKQYKGLIRLFLNNNNLGFIKNFEKAISLCSEEIIFLADQDDIWNYNKVERILEKFEKNPGSSYFFSDGILIDENDMETGEKLWDTVSFKRKKQGKFKAGFQKELLIKRNYITGATLAFRSQIKKYILPISANFVHDHWIAIILAFIDNSGNFINEPLIKYRVHSQQVLSVPTDSIWKIIKTLMKGHKQTFESQIRQFRDLKERLYSLHILNENDKKFIDGIIFYFSERNRMYEIAKKERLKAIGNLFNKGFYRKYSSSNLIAIKDFVQKVLF